MDKTLPITVNGEHRRIRKPATVRDLLNVLGQDPAGVAVERNLSIVPKSAYEETALESGDEIEIVHFVGGGDHVHQAHDSDGWTVAGRRFMSRLIVGTGKYKDFNTNALAVEAAGAEIVTVAVRRVNVSDPGTRRV